MLARPKAPQIPLPEGWQNCVKSAVLHASEPAGGR